MGVWRCCPDKVYSLAEETSMVLPVGPTRTSKAPPSPRTCEGLWPAETGMSSHLLDRVEVKAGLQLGP